MSTNQNPAFPNPSAGGGLSEQSGSQGGAGQSLRQNTTLSQVGVPIRIGQSPGPGTNCTVFLKIADAAGDGGGDVAYNGATVDLIARIAGHEVIVNTFTILATTVAVQSEVELTQGGVAADFWCVNITLNNAVLPANNLISSIVAFGVENSGGGGGAAAGAIVPIVLGPFVAGSGISGGGDFPVALGTHTYLVTGQVRVSLVGGAAEALGDSYAVTVPVTWKNIAGVTTLVTPTLAAPDVSNDPSLTGTIFQPTSSAGNGGVLFTIPATLDPYPATQVEVVITLIPIGSD